MFAFAILDTQRRTLFLARDFFGIKPLYYTTAGGGFAFASEAKALLALPGVSRRANAERLYLFLRYGLADHGGESMFEDLQQLPAAHYMEVPLDRPAGATPVRYWELQAGEDPGLSFDEAAARMRELFLESVDLHLRSDVAVGAALSGGVDSSAIVMAMRHLRGPAIDIHAFSFVAEEPRLSEERWAEMVAEAGRVRLHKVRADRADMATELEALVRRQDEPFASTSIYAQHLVFEAARAAGVPVMLDGQGADELFAGYPAYAGARLASLVRERRFADAARLGARLGGGWRQGLSVGQYLLPPSVQAPFRRLVGQSVRPAWLDAGWLARHGVRPRPMRGPMPRRDLLRHDLRETVAETSLPALLRYEDRNSMAHSVESRVPFLVPRLAEFAQSLPEEYILAPDGTTKAVFRAAMRGIVPDAILDRRDKIGFATPERLWLRGLTPWVDATLGSLRERPVAPLATDVVLREWEAVRRGAGRFDSRMWRWLNLVLWARQHDVVFD
jgi:asparagine synthase (glutamine-hydrolysing)